MANPAFPNLQLKNLQSVNSIESSGPRQGKPVISSRMVAYETTDNDEQSESEFGTGTEQNQQSFSCTSAEDNLPLSDDNSQMSDNESDAVQNNTQVYESEKIQIMNEIKQAYYLRQEQESKEK